MYILITLAFNIQSLDYMLMTKIANVYEAHEDDGMVQQWQLVCNAGKFVL